MYLLKSEILVVNGSQLESLVFILFVLFEFNNICENFQFRNVEFCEILFIFDIKLDIVIGGESVGYVIFFQEFSGCLDQRFVEDFNI